MANEYEGFADADLGPYYWRLRQPVTGFRWNVTTQTWELFLTSARGQYSFAASQVGTEDRYHGSRPTGISAAEDVIAELIRGTITAEAEADRVVYSRYYPPVSVQTIKASLDDIPTVAEFELRTILSTAYFDPATDRVQLHATQPDYAPAVAGNQMDIVNAPNATAVAAIQSGLSMHSAADVWAVATRSLTDKAGFTLASNGVDLVIIEGSITAGVGLTNDTGTQLTAINLRQALALILSGDGGILAGSDTSTSSNNITIKQAAKPAGVTRIAATTDEHGNRDSLTLKVPD